MFQFKDILGQDAVKEHLARAIEETHISHAYILSGETGMGKKLLTNSGMIIPMIPVCLFWRFLALRLGR